MQQTGQATQTVKPGATPQPEPPNGNGRKLSRLHLQKHLPAFGIVLNFFADTAAELWELYREMLSLIDDEVASAYAKATQASVKPAAAVAQQPKPATKPAPNSTKGNGGYTNAPVCEECGQPCKLIRWTDKATGEARKAWKCEPCDLWVRS